MTRRYLVGLALALVLLGSVAGAISVAPTASQFSDSERFADNRVGAADDWGITLAVDDGGDLEAADNGSDDLEITAIVTNEYRHAETVTVGLEVGNESETERVSLEGGETASVTFAVDDLESGEHIYVVTAGDERVEGTVAVDGGDDGDAADDDDEGADGDGDLGDDDDADSDGEDDSEAGESHGDDGDETRDSSEDES